MGFQAKFKIKSTKIGARHLLNRYIKLLNFDVLQLAVASQESLFLLTLLVASISAQKERKITSL